MHPAIIYISALDVMQASILLVLVAVVTRGVVPMPCAHVCAVKDVFLLADEQYISGRPSGCYALCKPPRHAHARK